MTLEVIDLGTCLFNSISGQAVHLMALLLPLISIVNNNTLGLLFYPGIIQSTEILQHKQLRQLSETRKPKIYFSLSIIFNPFFFNTY